MAPLIETSSIDGALYPVIPMREFYEQLDPETLRQNARELHRVGRAVQKRLGHKRIVGSAIFPWHDQTTLWWFEQGLINLMAAAGWDVTWVTDANYTFDDRLLSSLPGNVEVRRGAHHLADLAASDESYDGVVSLFVEDQTIHLANRIGAPLVSYSIKNIYGDTTCAVAHFCGFPKLYQRNQAHPPTRQVATARGSLSSQPLLSATDTGRGRF
jgi:hypothetical protein